MGTQGDSTGSLATLLDELESDLRSLGFIGTHKVLRLVKKLRVALAKDLHLDP